MCNMLVASDREGILKIAEELAARQIRHIDREQDDDEYMSDEDCDNLKDMICVLEKAACTRKLHFELEEMTAERLEAWRKGECGCVPMTTTSVPMHHGGATPTGVPVPVNRS